MIFCSTRATASGSRFSSETTRMARSAPIASPVRSCSCAALGPMLTSTTSLPAFFSLMRSASSTAISSKGLTTHFTLSVTKPVPSALIFSCVSGSGTRFTVTRIFTGSLLWGAGIPGLKPDFATTLHRGSQGTNRGAARAVAGGRPRHGAGIASALRVLGPCARASVTRPLACRGRAQGPAESRYGDPARVAATRDTPRVRSRSARFALAGVEPQPAGQIAARLHDQRCELLVYALGLEAVGGADDRQGADYVAGVVADGCRDAAHILHVLAHVDRVAA